MAFLLSLPCFTQLVVWVNLKHEFTVVPMKLQIIEIATSVPVRWVGSELVYTAW